jgi:hypothetical protein
LAATLVNAWCRPVPPPPISGSDEQPVSATPAATDITVTNTDVFRTGR